MAAQADHGDPRKRVLSDERAVVRRAVRRRDDERRFAEPSASGTPAARGDAPPSPELSFCRGPDPRQQATYGRSRRPRGGAVGKRTPEPWPEAHPRARELAPDPFFWDVVDELSPFGSDEGDTALAEYRGWRKKHRKAPLRRCLVWTIESVGEITIDRYDQTILDPQTIRRQIDDPEFDDHQFVFTVDASVIATVFGQLVDEGGIDADAKPFGERAIGRQMLWAQLQRDEWRHADAYVANLTRLREILAAA